MDDNILFKGFDLSFELMNSIPFLEGKTLTLEDFSQLCHPKCLDCLIQEKTVHQFH